MSSIYAPRAPFRFRTFLEWMPSALIAVMLGLCLFFHLHPVGQPDVMAGPATPVVISPVKPSFRAFEPGLDRAFWHRSVNANGEVEAEPLLGAITGNRRSPNGAPGIFLRTFPAKRLVSAPPASSAAASQSQSAKQHDSKKHRGENESGGIKIAEETEGIAPNLLYAVTGRIVDVAVGSNGTLQFSPSTVDIVAGDTVRWTWASDLHTVTGGKACSVDSKFCSSDNINCSTGATLNSKMAPLLPWAR